MTKKTIFYIVMFFIFLIIMIAGTIMCVYANSVWETQMNQIITTGLESLETLPIQKNQNILNLQFYNK